MGLNLRKLKDAAFAQINPFDGGKTANTVWNNTPVGYKDQSQTIRPTGISNNNGTIYINQQARQASQARPQQSFIPGNQKKPSGFMGALNAAIDSPLSPVSVGKEVFLGNGPLGYLGKATSTGPLAKPTQGIRDTLFDANTAKDIAKRNQAELAKAQMAKANGQVYTPKLNQTYMEQQASLGRRGRNNFGDQMVGGFAENLNTVGAKLYETPETLRGTVAASTGNQEALRMSLERQKKNAQMLYGKNSGGLLNTGTIYDSPEQTMNLSAGDTAKRVFGGQLEAASMVVGGGALPSIAKSGLKGLASYGGKTFASGAMGLGGNEMSTNPNASAMDIVKQSALGGVFGLGLGVAGDAAVKGVGMGVKAIKPKVELTKVNQQGSIDPAQAFKNIRDKLNGSALDTTVKPATPENVYGVNALEKVGNKLNQALGLNDSSQGGFAKLPGKAPKTEGVAPQIGKTVDDTAKVTFGELHDSGYLTDDVAGKLGKQYGLNAEQVKAIGKEHSVLSPTRQKMIKADEAQKAAQSTEKPKVTMQEGRANRVLDKKIRYNGKVMTRGEYIDALVSDGYAPTQKTVNGKTTYSMKSPKGDYYDISKIEYAKAQPTPPKGVAPKGAPKTQLAKDEVILYHRTSKANADELAKTGKMYSKENTGEVFLSNRPDEQILGYGDTVVPVKVKKSDIRLDDEFPSGEQHYAVKSDRATPIFDTPTPVSAPIEKTAPTKLSQTSDGTTPIKGISRSDDAKVLADELSSGKFVKEGDLVEIEYQPSGSQTPIKIEGTVQSHYGGITNNQTIKMIDHGKESSYIDYQADGKTLVKTQNGENVWVKNDEINKVSVYDKNNLGLTDTEKMIAEMNGLTHLQFARNKKIQQPTPVRAPIEKTVDAPKPVVKTAPVAKPVVKAAQPTKPNVVKSEVTKKKGFNDFVDEIAQSQGIETKYNAPEMFTFNKVLNKVSGGKMQNLMQISPARLASQKVEDKVASVAQKANVSRKGSKTLNTSRTMFAQTGISDADKMANRRFRDSQSLASDLTKGEMKISDDLASKLADPEKSLDNVYRVIADQKILERTHGKGARLKTKDLTPEEQTIANRIIDAQKRTNEINYRIGRITKEQYDAEKATGHYARMFNIESKGGKQLGKKPIDTMPFQERKDPAEFSDSLMELFIKDPFRGALARQEIAMRSLASHEFMGELVKQGRLLDRKPNKGFQQLNGKKYGKYDGMWADNTTRTQIKQNMEFESDWAKKYVGQLLDDYKSNVMGKTQRVLKATKTVLNPGTNVQNIMSNILFFNRGSGVGVIRNATGMARAAKDLAKAKGGKLNAELIQAKKLGVFGNDSGKAMVGDIGAESLASMPDKKNVIMKGLGVAEDIYGGTDNAAKLGLWRNLQKKGLSPEDAAKQVQKFTQDYHNVGRIVGAMADAPVLGKPFARFIPELVRLTKNNLAYNPAGTIAGLAAIAYAGNALSEKAGETDEERANREGVIGNTSLPGTRYINKALGGPDRDISLNFAVGNSSVNIARAVGLNFPSEPGQDPNRALLEQLLPFEIPTRKDAQGNEVFDGTKIVTHLGLRPIIETVADRNFMGQSIKDPENKVRVEGSELGKTYTGDVSKGEKTKNVASHLARAYLPMGNEIDSLVAAFKGEPNAMGKERTPMQAALRTVGVKVEKNDQAARDKRASTKEFFDGKLGQVNDFLNKNPDLKEQYLSIKSGTKDRSTGKKVVDLVGPEKWQKITGDKSGRLFDQMKAEDEYQNKQDPTYPIDPIFSNQLSKEQRNQLLEIRSSYSGSNIEQEEILRATKPWYQNFEAAERDANTKKSAYFDKLEKEGKLKNSSQNERVKAYGDLYDKYSPQQTPLMTKYYQLKDSNPDAAKALFSTNPELSDQFDAYKEQKLKYINEKRKIEGVPAIDRNTFMNVTFGYEDDERKVFNELKYGRGYGGYSKGGYSRRGGGSGGGGSGDGLASEYDNPYKYAVSIKAKGSSKATVKLGGKIAKRGVTAKATSKPKVTIKKSTA